MVRTPSSGGACVAARDLPTRGNQGPNRARFQKIFTEGRRAQGRYCRAFALPGTGQIGWATAKAIGEKPLRNRAKRRFREALRTQDYCIPDNLDFVVMIALSGAKAPFEEIRRDLEAVLGEVTRRWAVESGCSS